MFDDLGGDPALLRLYGDGVAALENDAAHAPLRRAQLPLLRAAAQVLLADTLWVTHLGVSPQVFHGQYCSGLRALLVSPVVAAGVGEGLTRPAAGAAIESREQLMHVRWAFGVLLHEVLHSAGARDGATFLHDRAGLDAASLRSFHEGAVQYVAQRGLGEFLSATGAARLRPRLLGVPSGDTLYLGEAGFAEGLYTAAAAATGSDEGALIGQGVNLGLGEAALRALTQRVCGSAGLAADDAVVDAVLTGGRGYRSWSAAPLPGCDAPEARSAAGVALGRAWVTQIRGDVTALREGTISLSAVADPIHTIPLLEAAVAGVRRHRSAMALA